MSWQPGAPLALATRNYALRTLASSDVGVRVMAWIRDPVVLAGLHLPTNASRRDFLRYLDRHDNRARFLLGIFARTDDVLIGFIAASCNHRVGVAETDVVVGDRAYWGKRVVIETRAALLDFLFDTLDMHKVAGFPHARNFPAIYNYRKLGFRPEGVLRKHAPGQSGGREDQIAFGLLRGEWHARRAELAL